MVVTADCNSMSTYVRRLMEAILYISDHTNGSSNWNSKKTAPYNDEAESVMEYSHMLFLSLFHSVNAAI